MNTGLWDHLPRFGLGGSVRNLLWVVLGGLAVACEPPPLSASGEPSIRIIYPPASTKAINRRTDGSLDVFLAVQIEGLEFVPAMDEPVNVPGQGHYHVNVNGSLFDMPDKQFYMLHIPAGDPRIAGPDTPFIRITTTLADNLHRELTQYENWEDVREVKVMPAGDDTVIPGWVEE